MTLNPISRLLNQFVNELLDDHTFTQIAQQLGMNREGLRLALREDKQMAAGCLDRSNQPSTPTYGYHLWLLSFRAKIVRSCFLAVFAA